MSIARGNRGRFGFTLIEITLAVAILGMMALAIYRFVATNVVAIRISSELNEADARYAGLVNLLTEQFQSLPPGDGALTGEPIKLDGRSRDELTWVCNAGEGLLTRYAAGEYSVNLRLRPMQNGKGMVLGVLRVSDDDFDATEEKGSWVPLLSDVNTMEIRYFDPRLNAWVDRWTDRSTLPHLVRITLTSTGSSVPWQAVIPLRRSPL